MKNATEDVLQAELRAKATAQALAWLQSPEGVRALIVAQAEAPVLREYHAGFLGFTLGRYAHGISTGQLDRVDIDEISKKLFGETTHEQVVKRQRAVQSSVRNEKTAAAACANGAKGGRPRKNKSEMN